MAQVILNKISFGTGDTFTLQDARVDRLQDIGWIIDRTQGQQGIEVRNNRLALTNGGYYETGALFEDVGNEYILAGDGTLEYTYDISNSPQNYIDWITDGNTVHIWLVGSNGRTEFEVELEGSFSVDGTDATFGLSDNNASLTDYGIQSIKVDLTNMEFNIFKDERNEDDLILTEIAVYLPESDPVQWPADLLDIDEIYTEIVRRLDADGYISALQI